MAFNFRSEEVRTKTSEGSETATVTGTISVGRALNTGALRNLLNIQLEKCHNDIWTATIGVKSSHKKPNYRNTHKFGAIIRGFGVLGEASRGF